MYKLKDIIDILNDQTSDNIEYLKGDKAVFNFVIKTEIILSQNRSKNEILYMAANAIYDRMYKE